MFYTNCDCLSQTKKVELESYIQSNSPDVIALTEVLPKNSIFDVNETEYVLQGYTCFSSDLTKGRGALLYIKNSIPAIDIEQNGNFLESTWCKINLSGGDNFIIGCIYRSPNSTSENTKLLFELIQDIAGRNLETCHIYFSSGILTLKVLTGTIQALQKMKHIFLHSS